MSIGITCEDPLHPFEARALLGALHHEKAETVAIDFALEKLDEQKQALRAKDWRPETLQKIAALESQILYALKDVFKAKADRAVDLFYGNLTEEAIERPRHAFLTSQQVNQYVEVMTGHKQEAAPVLQAYAVKYKKPSAASEVNISALSVAFKMVNGQYVEKQMRTLREMKSSVNPLKPGTHWLHG